MDLIKRKLWNDERIRLLRLRWEAEDRYRSFATDPTGVPTAMLPKGGVCAVEAPCCGVSAYHSGPILHKCAVCRKYYYVMEAETDD